MIYWRNRNCYKPVPYSPTRDSHFSFITETLITANVVDVPFWLNLDRAATDTTHVTVEKFKAIGGVVELATTKQGALHLVVQSSEQGAAVIGVELQVLPPGLSQIRRHSVLSLTLLTVCPYIVQYTPNTRR